MKLIKLTTDPQYAANAGVQKVPTPDGSEVWVAHVNLGRIDGMEADAVIVAEGRNEYLAIDRLLERCKAWSALLSFGMAEVFAPRVARLEKEATEELMRQVGIGPSDLPSSKKAGNLPS